MTTRKTSIFLLLLLISTVSNAQNSLPVFKILSDTGFANKLDKSYWQKLEDPQGKWTFDNVRRAPLSNKFHGNGTPSTLKDSASTNWIRFSLKNTLTRPVKISLGSKAELSDFYVLKNNNRVSHFATGSNYPWSKKPGLKKLNAIPVVLEPQEVVSVYIREYKSKPFTISRDYVVPLYITEKITEKEFFRYQDNYERRSYTYFSFISGLLLLASIFNLLVYRSVKNKVNLYFSLFLLCLFFEYQPFFGVILLSEHPFVKEYLILLILLWVVFFMFFIRHYFKVFEYFPRWDKFLQIFTIVMYLAASLAVVFWSNSPWVEPIMGMFYAVYLLSLIITVLISARVKGEHNKIFYIALSPLFIVLITSFISSLVVDDIIGVEWSDVVNYIGGGALMWAVVVFSKYLFEDYGKQQQQILQVQIEKEKEQVQFMALQKIALEKEVTERTQELKQSLEELKATQAQLIQSEKMASLGELTAGIAHEIQNPLNFVNNFSEVSMELIEEVKGEKLKAQSERDEQLETELLDDIAQNLQKIAHHGKRADSIVKGMLQHSRTSTGEKQPTNLNMLADEFLKLSYHGLRAKDKSFNAELVTNFDESLPKVNVVQQDIGRVLLNLFNNAFYAMQERRKAEGEGFNPTVEVSTLFSEGYVTVKVRDNGNGIPEAIKEKIMQPFFTTKPTGEGTGLGLSLSYDIVKAHGGEIKIETIEGEYTAFSIIIPSNPILV